VALLQPVWRTRRVPLSQIMLIGVINLMQACRLLKFADKLFSTILIQILEIVDVSMSSHVRTGTLSLAERRRNASSTTNQFYCQYETLLHRG
jgi:hypothetical protein